VSRDDRVEKKIYAGERSDVGGRGTRRLEPVTSGSAANTTVNAGGEASKRAGEKKGGRGPLRCLTSGGAANTTVNAGGEASKRAGEKKGGRGPLLLGDGIEVGWEGGGKVDRAEGASGLDQLHQFGVAGEKPLHAMRTREGRAEGERGAGGVKVEDGRAGGGDGGLG
jgi:hypothetical protein